jgi:flagellar protein FliS
MGAHSGVMDATPHRWIKMLLDGALSRILSAKGHMKANDIALKGEQIGSAISIIEGLKASLDFKQGGEISKN